jgi:hypothetical protein
MTPSSGDDVKLNWLLQLSMLIDTFCLKVLPEPERALCCEQLLVD